MLDDAPWSFAASPADDRALDPVYLASALHKSEYVIFAAEATADEPAELVGSVGIFRSPHEKFRHRAKIWGVFVNPAHRGRGLGRALMHAALDTAREWPDVDYLDLAVSESAPAALRLYESLGFRVWGREPESMAIGERRFDELFMTLRIG